MIASCPRKKNIYIIKRVYNVLEKTIIDLQQRLSSTSKYVLLEGFLMPDIEVYSGLKVTSLTILLIEMIRNVKMYEFLIE